MKPLTFIIFSFFYIPFISAVEIDYSVGFTAFHSNASGLRNPASYAKTGDWDFVPSYEMSLLLDQKYIISAGYLDYPKIPGGGSISFGPGMGLDVWLPVISYYSGEEKVDEYFLSLGRRWPVRDSIYIEPIIGCSVFDSYSRIGSSSFSSTDVVPFASFKIGFECSDHLSFFTSVKYSEPRDCDLLMLGAGIGYTF